MGRPLVTTENRAAPGGDRGAGPERFIQNVHWPPNWIEQAAIISVGRGQALP